jgi:SulP family sulfate permease
MPCSKVKSGWLNLNWLDKLNTLSRYFPILDWGRTYKKTTLTSDLVAAMIVTIMLVPQSLAYALLAGLPPEVGLYASMLPLVVYAIFGTSRTLAVGPVAVVSLMTAAALGKIAAQGSVDYLSAAVTLAFISGGILLILGISRLGFLANFLSHPVIAGFITASGLMIAASQLKHIFGVKAGGNNLYEILTEVVKAFAQTNYITLAIGVSATAFLFWVRKGLRPLLEKAGIRPYLAGLLARTGPVAAIAATTIVAWWFDLGHKGVKLVGAVPQGLPPFSYPSFSPELWRELALPALLISVVGFVESVSVGHTLAAKRRQRIEPDQELIGLGVSNIAGALTGGYPVTGGFARSVVNFDAGAETPAAGAYTAVGLAFATLFLTPLLSFLPQATLAATIIVAVLSLVDLSILKKTWVYSKADFAAVVATILMTLGLGVEIGITAGVVLSILIHLYKTSRPHIAMVGQVPGTEHFRNVLRHDVETDPTVLSIRVDESLYFANARYLEDYIYTLIVKNKTVQHIVLMCSAVNDIDMSALESLESINQRLKDAGVTFHLSEVKGPVMDRLQRSGFLPHLTEEVFLSHHKALIRITNSEKVVGPV